MKKYEVTASFWRRNNLVAVGETLRLSDAEAKYLGHAVTPTTVEVAPAAVVEETPAVEDVAEVVDAQIEDAEPVEEPVDEPKSGRSRRQRGKVNGDDG